jgi:hypothetical protein
MRPIQYVLLLLLVGGFWIYLRFLRSRSRDRLIVFAVFSAAMIFVLMPSWSSSLAQRVGVGRGVDLVIYFALMLLGFICLVLYSQLRQLKGQITALARDAALREAQLPVLEPPHRD